MRDVNHHLLEEKIEEAVTHYITHQPGDPVHVDTNSLSLNIQGDEGNRVVTVMHPQNFPQQMCRQVSVSEQVDGPWVEEILDPESRLAAIVAHLTQNQRHPHQPPHHKITSVRGDVESSVMLDGQMRLFNAQTLDQQSDPIVVQLPSLPPLPPLQEMKRCPDADWFNKSKAAVKSDGPLLAGARQPSRRSLPHKKRISRKLKRNVGNSTPQHDIVVLSCNDEIPQEEILPDNFVTEVQHQTHLTEETHHNITHEVRPVLLCTLCGEYYGEEQLKFYQHLKQHYEPHAIIIEHPGTDLGIDKMTNTCIEDNVATLPDSIVELSLENTVPKTMYQAMDKHVMYTSSEKPIHYSSNKLQYSMASMDKDVPPSDVEKTDLYETLDKLDIYNCVKCSKSFRKQKQCEAHIKEVHGKLEDMGEFSEPEDLMEGIHVAVEGEEPADGLEPALLPHLTVENGTVHQDHVRHWYLRGAAGCGAACCPRAPPHAHPAHAEHAAHPAQPAHPAHAEHAAHDAHPAHAAHDAHDAHDAHAHPDAHHLKEEVFQRIFDVEVPAEGSNFAENMMPDGEPAEPAAEPPAAAAPAAQPAAAAQRAAEPEPLENKKGKRFDCPQCSRVFLHRNSLLYHMLSHNVKQHVCRECNKGFYTSGALKIHKRVHNGDRPYKCEECDREFRQWSDLKYHKVSIHSNQKHFKCEFCGKEFARKYSLSVHRRIHTGERNYKCEYCHKSFRASSYRLAHMRTHTGDKPFKCAQCGKGFRVAGDLRRHALTHERVRDRYDKPVKVKEEEDKKSTKQKTERKEQKIKKVAAASTTKLPILKSILDKKSPKVKKEVIKKIGAPNVTVNPKDEQFKMNEFTNNVEVFDTRHYKFREVYLNKDEQIRQYDLDDRLPDERNFAVLKPMFRDDTETVETEKVYSNRAENTDGKLAVFTQVEKSGSSSQSLSDIRHLERDGRSDGLNGEAMENGFLERLAALYNIPPV